MKALLHASLILSFLTVFSAVALADYIFRQLIILAPLRPWPLALTIRAKSLGFKLSPQAASTASSTVADLFPRSTTPALPLQ